MRLIYIFVVIIAATLQASGTALHATKDSKAMIENDALTQVVDAIHTDGGRQLLRVEKQAENDGIEEERFFSKVGKWIQKWKASRAVSKAAKTTAYDNKRRQWIEEAGGIPKRY